MVGVGNVLKYLRKREWKEGASTTIIGSTWNNRINGRGCT
jgi:hypothetical protein